MTNDSTDQSSTLSLLIELNADGRHVWHSTLPAATGPIQRLRHRIESSLDDLDFAQWLFVLCITATVLVIRRRLRETAATLIRLFFEWSGCFKVKEIEKEK